MNRRSLLQSTLGCSALAALSPQILVRRERTNWSGRDLRGADLREHDLSGADLSGALLTGADLSRADLRGANLDRAHLGNATLAGARMSEASLREAEISGNADYANLLGALLIGSKISNIKMRNADISGADFRGATIAGRLWLDQVRAVRTNFSEIAYARDADTFVWLDASFATFDGAILEGLKAVCSVRDASFRGARLAHVCFGYERRGANVRETVAFGIGGADFSGADLTNADLRYGHEDGGDGYPSFVSANLTGAKIGYLPGNDELAPMSKFAPSFAGTTLCDTEINGVYYSALRPLAT